MNIILDIIAGVIWKLSSICLYVGWYLVNLKD